MIRSKLATDSPDQPGSLHSLFFVTERIGLLVATRGDLSGAEKLYKNAVMIGEKLISRKESTATIQEDVSLVYLRLCDVSVAEGELNEALHHAQRSLAMRQALVLQDPNNAAYLRDLAMSIEKTGEVLTQQGELNEATRSFQDCLET